MKQYWQFEFYRDGHKRTRFFYGTEAALQRRTKKYECDRKDVRNISKTRADFLKTEKKAHFIDL
ncbi:MAG: hypothetical protein ABRQ24_01765 [Syntrophomonadaceae bacterium]